MILKPLALKVAVITVLLTLALIVIVQWRASAREATAEMHYPPAGDFVDIDGTRIHIKVTGQGSDIVLIHGASGSLRDYTFDLAERLADTHRVIAVDRPGLGWSERPPGFGGVWSTAAEPPRLQAKLLQAAADQVGVQNPIVIGHSFGGAIALAWALERPQQTAGLVLLGGVSNPWPGQLGLLYRVNSSLLGSAIVIPMITAFTPQAVISDTLSEIFAPQKPPEGYLDHFGPEMTLRRPAMRANAQQVNSLRPHIVEMSKEYSSLELPVEILHGTEDDTVPISIHSEPLSEQLPNGQLRRMEGIGHMPHHAEPDAVIVAIARLKTRMGLR